MPLEAKFQCLVPVPVTVNLTGLRNAKRISGAGLCLSRMESLEAAGSEVSDILSKSISWIHERVALWEVMRAQR